MEEAMARHLGKWSKVVMVANPFIATNFTNLFTFAEPSLCQTGIACGDFAGSVFLKFKYEKVG